MRLPPRRCVRQAVDHHVDAEMSEGVEADLARDVVADLSVNFPDEHPPVPVLSGLLGILDAAAKPLVGDVGLA